MYISRIASSKLPSTEFFLSVKLSAKACDSSHEVVLLPLVPLDETVTAIVVSDFCDLHFRENITIPCRQRQPCMTKQHVSSPGF